MIDYCHVTYEVTELDERLLGYATTIHKAQGSEYPVVVMPVLMTHFVMLQRNLIYTGITRAKKILVMVGTKKALAYAVRNLTGARRNTMLKERLAGEIPVKREKEPAAVYPFETERKEGELPMAAEDVAEYYTEGTFKETK